MERLTQLLRPILHKATNLRSLSLPIHMATANLLDDHAFGYLGKDLRIKTAYDWILGLDEITLVRSPVQCDQLYLPPTRRITTPTHGYWLMWIRLSVYHETSAMTPKS